VALEPANHFELNGKGISAVVDTPGLAGGATVIALDVNGIPIDDATLDVSPFGNEITALIESAPDGFDVYLRLTFPQVNVDRSAVTFTGLAVLATALTTIGGPGLVRGALHRYEIRPIAGTASVVQS
jgi:hypothetical protein